MFSQLSVAQGKTLGVVVTSNSKTTIAHTKMWNNFDKKTLNLIILTYGNKKQ